MNPDRDALLEELRERTPALADLKDLSCFVELFKEVAQRDDAENLKREPHEVTDPHSQES